MLYNQPHPATNPHAIEVNFKRTELVVTMSKVERDDIGNERSETKEAEERELDHTRSNIVFQTVDIKEKETAGINVHVFGKSKVMVEVPEDKKKSASVDDQEEEKEEDEENEEIQVPIASDGESKEEL